MSVSIQDVSNLFHRYGWSHRDQGDGQTILSGFQGENGYFKMAAFLREGWLSLTTLDYLPEVPSDKQMQVYRYLLESNSKITFIRLALVDEGQVSLVADLPAESRLDYDLFSMAMDLITYYADQLYPGLYEQIVGQKPPLTHSKEIL